MSNILPLCPCLDSQDNRIKCFKKAIEKKDGNCSQELLDKYNKILDDIKSIFDSSIESINKIEKKKMDAITQDYVEESLPMFIEFKNAIGKYIEYKTKIDNNPDYKEIQKCFYNSCNDSIEKEIQNYQKFIQVFEKFLKDRENTPPANQLEERHNKLVNNVIKTIIATYQDEIIDYRKTYKSVTPKGKNRKDNFDDEDMEDEDTDEDEDMDDEDTDEDEDDEGGIEKVEGKKKIRDGDEDGDEDSDDEDEDEDEEGIEKVEGKKKIRDGDGDEGSEDEEGIEKVEGKKKSGNGDEDSDDEDEEGIEKVEGKKKSGNGDKDVEDDEEGKEKVEEMGKTGNKGEEEKEKIEGKDSGKTTTQKTGSKESFSINGFCENINKAQKKDLLFILNNFNEKGVSLNKKFTMRDSYEDMEKEYKRVIEEIKEPDSKINESCNKNKDINKFINNALQDSKNIWENPKSISYCPGISHKIDKNCDFILKKGKECCTKYFKESKDFFKKKGGRKTKKNNKIFFKKTYKNKFLKNNKKFTKKYKKIILKKYKKSHKNIN